MQANILVVGQAFIGWVQRVQWERPNTGKAFQNCANITDTILTTWSVLENMLIGSTQRLFVHCKLTLMLLLRAYNMLRSGCDLVRKQMCLIRSTFGQGLASDPCRPKFEILEPRLLLSASPFGFDVVVPQDSFGTQDIVVNNWDEVTVRAGNDRVSTRASDILRDDNYLPSSKAGLTNASIQRNVLIVDISPTHSTTEESGTDTQTGKISTITFASHNTAPVANAGGPYTISEGNSVTLDASASTDPESNPLTYSWDINNDNVFGDVTGVSPTLTWAQLQGFGINDDGVYTIKVQASDGSLTNNASTTITVSNTAPVLNTTGSSSVDNGSVYTLNLSVTDAGNDTISSWVISWGDGNIQTVAGNPSSVVHTYASRGSYNILASATDEDGTYQQNNLLVGGFLGTNSVLEYEATSGNFVQLIGSLGDGLNLPHSVIQGPDGNLYVSSYTGDSVLRYDTSGNLIGTFVSSGSGGLNSPTYITFGADDNLYVASLSSNQILRYNGSTGAFIDAFVSTSSGGLSTPSGITFGPDGNLYVSSLNTNQVLRYNGSTGAFMSVFVSTASGGLGQPAQLTFGPDGNLYVASRADDAVHRYNGTTGAYIDTFVTSGSGGINGNVGLAFGPDGNLYVSARSSNNVLRYNGTSGAFIDVFVTTGSGGLSGPGFITFVASQQVRVNGVPTNIALSNSAVNENVNTTGGFSVGSLTSTDPDNYESFTYSVVGGTDSANFSIGGGSSDQLFIDDGVLDFETQSSYEVIVRTTDSNGGKFDKTFTITINDLNDAPTATNLSDSDTYIEDIALNLTNIVISDVDSANVTATLTLSDVAAGSLSTATSGVVTSTYSAMTGVWTASGALADVNTLLAGVTFTPTLNYNSNFTIATSVDDGMAAAITGTKTIIIGVAPSPADVTAPTLVNNTGSTIAEGGTDTLTNAELRYNDSEQPASSVIYTVTGGLANGQLELTTDAGVSITSFTQAQIDAGQVVYVHNGSNTTSDNFSFTVNDGQGNTLTGQSFALTITVENDTPTTTGIDDIAVSEDEAPTGIDLFAAFDDTEDTDAQLSYAVVDNTNSGLLDSAVIDATAGTMTLVYAPDASGVGNITVRATDSSGAFVETTFTVTVAATNDAPTLTTNTGLTSDIAAMTTIDATYLEARDVDNSAEQLTYTVTSIPGNGVLTLNGTELGVGDTFTQDDIDNNRFAYQNDGNQSISDGFSFIVSDGAAGSISSTVFTITFNTINDTNIVSNSDNEMPIDAPVILPETTELIGEFDQIFVDPILDELSEEALVGVAQTDSELIDNAEKPTNEESLDSEESDVEESPAIEQQLNDDTSNPSSGDSRDFAQVSVARDDRSSAVPFTNAQRRTVSKSNTANTRQSDGKTNTQSQSFVTNYQASLQSTQTEGIQQNTVTDQPALISPKMARELDSFAQKFNLAAESEVRIETLTVGTVAGLSSVLSVGYVVWAIRGGSLVASMLSALPVWRFADPLPVLEYSKKSSNQQRQDENNDDDEDEQELSAIFD